LNRITLKVNGKLHELDVKPNRTLLEVLREDLDLIGAKDACQTGDCGACTVIVDGRPILSCLSLAVSNDGEEVTTIEGLAKDGTLHVIQQKFIDHTAIQCGFCTPGLVMIAKALLDSNPNPTDDQIRDYIRGNICRCTGYTKVVEAIRYAAEELRAINLVK
jgi:carbon-monoxide dehydrogenase small subunit